MELYHVLNRGVDKRKIFLSERDYVRFVHDLFEFNDEENVFNSGYFFAGSLSSPERHKIGGTPAAHQARRKRKLIVHVLAFCLMPNHYHLLLQPQTDTGLSLFMQKLNGGYSRYFNKKYKRSGALFQGKYKSILVEDEAHFIHLPYYIHCNPLDLVMPQWREGRIENPKKAFTFLNTYRWSSFLDYIGKKNFPSVTQREFLSAFFDSPSQYEKEMVTWLNTMGPTAFQELALE